jgi:hypothetical protein
MTTALKLCGSCEVEKPTTLFSADTRKAGAFFSHCKECRNAIARNKHKSHVPPTQAEVRLAYSYDVDTGEITLADGAATGHTTLLGYKSMFIRGRPYLQHRIAWLYVYGYLPLKHIDHVNGDGTNNAIANLREATSTQNAQNKRAAQANNKIGLLGVNAHQNGWRSRITKNKKCVDLGVFETPEKAAFAYLQAKRELHEFCTI